MLWALPELLYGVWRLALAPGLLDGVPQLQHLQASTHLKQDVVVTSASVRDFGLSLLFPAHGLVQHSGLDLPGMAPEVGLQLVPWTEAVSAG